MLRTLPLLLLTGQLLACAGPGRPPVLETALPAAQADTCDGPDVDIHCCFLGAPAGLSETVAIAEEREPGPRIQLTGRIVDAANGAPLPGVLLYVFHTDATGHYTKRGDEQGVQRWQGHLHGWLRTGADGRYAVRTIRPAPYPDGSMPAHLHAALQLPDGRACWVNDFVFADDPMVTDGYLTGLNNPGNPKDRDNGVVRLTEQEDMHIGARDIVVDRNAVVH
ncbi:MAG: hypothetical protein IPL86_15740 [Flavobacteriales bacterium]|jgi:protocatechuate 3,4-dioxygenase beta subunit|nr:hypothetical protein [Flavobacteriales bacterium]